MTKRDRGTELKVGLLILVALGVLVGFVFVLGNFSLSSGYELYVDYRFSGNIQAGAPVKVSGIKVGKVQEVRFVGGELDEATGRRVQVRLKVWVESRVKDTIRKDAEFFINTSGVLGAQYLEIVPGDNYDDGPLEPGAIVRGMDPPRTDLIISRLYEVLDSLSGVLYSERDLIKNMLHNTAGTVEELNGLLKDNRKQIGELITTTNALAGEATVALKEINTGIDGDMVAKTLRDADRLLVTANTTITDVAPPARELIKDATRVTGLITSQRVDRAIDVADKAVAVTGKAGKLIDNVDGMVSDLRKGKGTAGALLVREEVYADLREMIRDLKRNPWKFFWKE